MRFTDNLIQKFGGADKLLHCSLAGWAVSIAGYFGPVFALIVTLILIAASYTKEKKLDDYPDWYDFYAAILGILVSWIIIFISMQ